MTTLSTVVVTSMSAEVSPLASSWLPLSNRCESSPICSSLASRMVSVIALNAVARSSSRSILTVRKCLVATLLIGVVGRVGVLLDQEPLDRIEAIAALHLARLELRESRSVNVAAEALRLVVGVVAGDRLRVVAADARRIVEPAVLAGLHGRRPHPSTARPAPWRRPAPAPRPGCEISGLAQIAFSNDVAALAQSKLAAWATGTKNSSAASARAKRIIGSLLLPPC